MNDVESTKDNLRVTDEVSVVVLGSSSSGNATFVRIGRKSFLVDCGFSPEYIRRRLRELGSDLSDIEGVFITHSHGDHVNPWFVQYACGLNVPFLCPSDLELHLQAQYKQLSRASHRGLLRCFAGDQIQLGDCAVHAFPVPHDSPGGCFGYGFIHAASGTLRKITVATDIAYPTETIVQACANSNILLIESNHDPAMLENSRRPAWLKRRIRERGHLANYQSAEIIRRTLDLSDHLPQAIMLAHVSQECNTNEIAYDCALAALRQIGAESVHVKNTYPFRSSSSSQLSGGPLQ